MPSPEIIAEDLTLKERLLLFCVASGTDLLGAGVTGHTIQLGIVKGFVRREGGEQRLVLTDLGRAALLLLLGKAGFGLAPSEPTPPKAPSTSAGPKPGQDSAAEIFRPPSVAPQRDASQRGSGAVAVDDRRSSPNSGRGIAGRPGGETRLWSAARVEIPYDCAMES